jgi:hypothetical protein
VARGAPALRRLLAVGLGLTAIVVVGCGGGDDKKSTKSTATSPPATTSTGTTAPPASTTPSAKTRPPASSPRTPNPNAPQSQQQPEPPTGTPVGKVPTAGGSAADRKAVIRTVRTYLLAIARGNGEEACAQLTPGGQRRMIRKVNKFAPETIGVECAGVVLLYQGAYGDAIKHPKVTGVRVKGKRARAVGPVHQVARLVQSGRLWRISAYGQ